MLSAQSNRVLMHEWLKSPSIAKLAFERYRQHVAELASISDSRLRLHAEKPYYEIVAEVRDELEAKPADYRQKDLSQKLRRKTKHRIGPFLTDIGYSDCHQNLPEWLGSTRILCTVDRVVEDFVRASKGEKMRALWAKIPDHLAGRGISARDVSDRKAENIRNDLITWEVEGRRGQMAFGQFEKIFTRARKPKPTISG